MSHTENDNGAGVLADVPSSTGTFPPDRALHRRPSKVVKAILMWLRRMHLYFGLLLLPWAFLYGITAFLFNHPAVLADKPLDKLPRSVWAETVLADAPDAEATARAVFAVLKQRQPSASDWHLERPDKAIWLDDLAFVTGKTEDGGQVSLAYDMWSGTATKRITPPIKTPEKESEPAPFAVGKPAPPQQPATGSGADDTATSVDRLELPSAYPDRLRQAAPVMLERQGIPVSDLKVTSVPALKFQILVDGVLWDATYDSMAGIVTGKRAETAAGDGLSVRRFLLGLHLTHGYPSSWGPRWFWAVVVDAMAFVMCFWGASGLFMWWQIKATRLAGGWVLLASAATAVALGIGMHQVLAG